MLLSLLKSLPWLPITFKIKLRLFTMTFRVLHGLPFLHPNSLLTSLSPFTLNTVPSRSYTSKATLAFVASLETTLLVSASRTFRWLILLFGIFFTRISTWHTPHDLQEVSAQSCPPQGDLLWQHSQKALPTVTPLSNSAVLFFIKLIPAEWMNRQ